MAEFTEQQIDERAKELKRLAHRKWQQENRDKTKEYRKRYWQKKALQELEQEQQA